MEQIQKKNLANTLLQMKCMLLYLHGYDVTIKYYVSKEMLLTGALSFYSLLTGAEIVLDIARDHIQLADKCKTIFRVLFVTTQSCIHCLV